LEREIAIDIHVNSCGNNIRTQDGPPFAPALYRLSGHATYYHLLSRLTSSMIALTPSSICSGCVWEMLIRRSFVHWSCGGRDAPPVFRTAFQQRLYRIRSVLGVVSSLLTAWLSNYILSKMEASRMSVFANLSTIVSMAAGAVFLGEEVAVYHGIGSVLIIAGVIGANRLGRKKRAAFAAPNTE
jgi:multidrug transporter EmrE-like cation transporter